MPMYDIKGGKCKSLSEAFRILYHQYREAGLDLSEFLNEDINPEWTHLNFSVNGYGYKEARKKIQARYDEVTEGKHVRKNAVSVVFANVTYPYEIPPERIESESDQVVAELQEFGRCLLDVAKQQFGEKNVIDVECHVDEIHPYIDARTGEQRISLPHYVVSHVPAIEGHYENWKDEKGKKHSKHVLVEGEERLDCQHAFSRKQLKSMCDRLDDLSIDLFDERYHKTSKPYRKLPPEVLKGMSAQIEQVREHIIEHDMQRIRQTNVKRIEQEIEVEKKRARMEGQAESNQIFMDRLAQLDAIKADEKKAIADRDTAKQELAQLTSQLNAQRKALEKAKADEKKAHDAEKAAKDEETAAQKHLAEIKADITTAAPLRNAALNMRDKEQDERQKVLDKREQQLKDERAEMDAQSESVALSMSALATLNQSVNALIAKYGIDPYAPDRDTQLEKAIDKTSSELDTLTSEKVARDKQAAETEKARKATADYMYTIKADKREIDSAKATAQRWLGIDKDSPSWASDFHKESLEHDKRVRSAVLDKVKKVATFIWQRLKSAVNILRTSQRVLTDPDANRIAEDFDDLYVQVRGDDELLDLLGEPKPQGFVPLPADTYLPDDDYEEPYILTAAAEIEGYQPKYIDGKGDDPYAIAGMDDLEPNSPDVLDLDLL